MNDDLIGKKAKFFCKRTDSTGLFIIDGIIVEKDDTHYHIRTNKGESLLLRSDIQRIEVGGGRE